jgi:glutaredoxin
MTKIKSKIVEKIILNKDKYVIFYSEWCAYSESAIKMLTEYNLPFKGYIIENIDGGLDRIITDIKEYNSIVELNFINSHKTRPIVFFKGKFIGGYTELKNILQK